MSLYSGLVISVHPYFLSASSPLPVALSSGMASLISLPEGSVFSAAVCKIQANKCYVEFLPLMLNEAASLKVKGSLYSCLLIVCLPSGSRMLN